jgi:hypothetical protein
MGQPGNQVKKTFPNKKEGLGNGYLLFVCFVLYCLFVYLIV